MRGKNDFSTGDSPGKSFIVENLKKAMPNKMEVPPITTRTLLHESHSSKPSQIIGASRKLKLGANSCMPIAFPQFRLLIEDVSMAIPEGRYNADVMPTTNNPMRILNRLWLRPVTKNAMPVATAEKTIVFLCLIREETNPEHNNEIKYPDADIKKKEPAWS
jgi:hypothetical protein